MPLRLPVLPYRAFRGLVGLLLRPDVTFVGVRNVPDGPCIACSNHPSREEILLGYRIFRRPVRILLQMGLFDPDHVASEFRQALEGGYRFPGPVHRWLGARIPWLSEHIVRQIVRIRSIPVARPKDGLDPGAMMTANRHAIRRAVRALRRGEVIGMAPEGVWSPDDGVGELQKGAATIAWHFARKGEPVPVLPIIFHGMRGMERSLFGKGRLVVAVGAPIAAGRLPGEDRTAYLDRITAELHRRLVGVSRMVLSLPAKPPASWPRLYGRAEAPPLSGPGGPATRPPDQPSR